jgi:DNA-binding GntR family transcriptional regulator
LKKLDTSKNNHWSLTEQVFETLQESILNGELKPGDPLPEIRLSEELGVSRTPVREALRKLELEGLVKTIPNRGTFVVGISEKDIEDIYTIRMYIEGLAAKWAAANITDELLEEMRSIVELQKFYAEKNDPFQVWQLDSRFHYILYQASGSRVLKQTLTSMHHYIQRTRELSISRLGRAATTVQEHLNIFNAIEQHDGELAEKLTFEHIFNAYENIKK